MSKNMSHECTNILCANLKKTFRMIDKNTIIQIQTLIYCHSVNFD